MSRIAIVAGEESGDARGAALMREVCKLDSTVSFFGAGGPQMQALSGQPFDNWIQEAGVLGLWDVLRQYPYFRKKFNALRTAILAAKPHAVVFVDYPGFNLRMAAALRPLLPETKLIQYISPQVWAWNRRRIPRMAQILDRMICIFPFEESLFENSGLKTSFVGHPLVEELVPSNTVKEVLERDPLLLGLFPGSRNREVHRLFPVLLETIKKVQASRPEVRAAVAAACQEQADWMEARASEAGIECSILVGQTRQLMQTAAAGLVCSGTASLEAALLGLPYALIYRVNWLTYQVGRRLVKIPFLGIVNVLANRPVVREFIQYGCNSFALADESLRLLNSEEARGNLSRDLKIAVSQLGGAGASRNAAEVVLQEIK